MDTVRLRIVYETQQASSRLNGLNRQLSNLNSSTRTTSSAIVGMAQALATGDISAVALTNRISFLGGKLGQFGAGAGVAAGLLLLFKKAADSARAATAKLDDQLRDVRKSVDDLFRTSPKSPLQTTIENITGAIRELDRTLATQRMGLLERLGIKPTLKRGRDDPISKAIMRFLTGGGDPELVKQRGALQGELNRLTPENERAAISGRASFEQGTARVMARLLKGSELDKMADALANSRKELEALIVAGLDPMGEQAKAMAASILQGEDALRRMTRAANLLKGGMETMADAVEEFMITGTFAFTEFLNNILSLLYRDFTGSIIDTIMRGVTSVPGSGTGGSGGIVGGTQTTGNVGGGMSGSVVSNVTFNVQAIDAQSTAQFFQREGDRIAATVASRASRSRALRGKLTRG